MATFRLELVTPERRLFADDVAYVRAPGVDGSFGVLAGHAPLLTALDTGLIKLDLPNGKTIHAATGGGFAQVTRDGMVILADSAEFADEIDVERARLALERARRILDGGGDDEMTADEARFAIGRALNRIGIASGQV